MNNQNLRGVHAIDDRKFLYQWDTEKDTPVDHLSELKEAAEITINLYAEENRTEGELEYIFIQYRQPTIIYRGNFKLTN